MVLDEGRPRTGQFAEVRGADLTVTSRRRKAGRQSPSSIWRGPLRWLRALRPPSWPRSPRLYHLARDVEATRAARRAPHSGLARAVRVAVPAARPTSLGIELGAPLALLHRCVGLLSAALASASRARERVRHSGEPPESPLSRLLVRSGDGLSVLKVDDVDWVEAADNYVKVHARGETHLLRETLAHLQSRLDPARFLRIHRSTLVNLERIQSLHPLFHGDQIVLLRDGTELTLSRRYRHDVETLLGRPSRP